MSALSGRGRDPDADKQRFMQMASQAASSPREELSRNNPLAVGGLGRSGHGRENGFGALDDFTRLKTVGLT